VNGLLSPNLKVLNEPKYFSEFDLNEHSVLAALLIDSQDFLRGWESFRVTFYVRLRRRCHPSSKIQAHGEAPEEEREFGIFTPVEHIRKRRPRLRFG